MTAEVWGRLQIGATVASALTKSPKVFMRILSLTIVPDFKPKADILLVGLD